MANLNLTDFLIICNDKILYFWLFVEWWKIVLDFEENSLDKEKVEWGSLYLYYDGGEVFLWKKKKKLN